VHLGPAQMDAGAALFRVEEVSLHLPRLFSFPSMIHLALQFNIGSCVTNQLAHVRHVFGVSHNQKLTYATPGHALFR
jgi:hypothetical protein